MSKSTNFSVQPIACPACGSEGQEPHREFRLIRRREVSALADVRDDPWQIVRCIDCQHCYLSPAPTPDSFRQYYGSDYFSADETAPANQVLSLTAQDRFLFSCSRSIPSRDRTGLLLDVGPGNRKYLLWARDHLGMEVAGFDLAEYPCVQGAEDIPVHLGDFLDSGLPDNHFQVVTLWWILENVYRADDYLRECFRILKPGGLLAVGVCNFGCPEAKLFGSYWHHLVLPEHLSQFTPDTLRATVGRAGFGEPTLSHQALSFDTSLSLDAVARDRFGFGLPVHNPLVRVGCLPFGWLKSLLRVSGNISIHARKPLADSALHS